METEGRGYCTAPPPKAHRTPAPPALSRSSHPNVYSWPHVIWKKISSAYWVTRRSCLKEAETGGRNRRTYSSDAQTPRRRPPRWWHSWLPATPLPPTVSSDPVLWRPAIRGPASAGCSAGLTVIRAAACGFTTTRRKLSLFFLSFLFFASISLPPSLPSCLPPYFLDLPSLPPASFASLGVTCAATPQSREAGRPRTR